MQSYIARLRQSPSLRVVTIGVLILVLLIPLAMIEGVIEDRIAFGQAARNDITRTWGGSQLVAGPVLVIPYEIAHIASNGERYVNRSRAFLLPADLEITATVDSEVRERGIHRVPVYSSEVLLRGTFSAPDLGGLNIDNANIDWDGAFLALGVSDARAITETPDVIFSGETIRFEPGGEQIANLPSQIIAPVGELLNDDRRAGELPFEIPLSINGSDSLRFLPLGDTTRVSMRSSWPSPSFSGSYLPEKHEVDESGFTANWKVSSIGRLLPSRWIDGSSATSSAQASCFGVDLYMPISVYRLTLRATKYAVLFIGLTFVAYFMFEVVAGLRLHPLQYLLVGFANALFYLLLISLAEHIGFGWSYLVSCAASCGLIVGYSQAVLGTRQRATIMAAILILLYSFLYMTLQADTYAMLAGSIALWVSLAVIMYLTRRIDWYAKVEKS